VPDGKGGSEAWGFENAGPAELNRIGGWTRTSVKLGDKVTVKFCQLKSGKHGGVFSSVTLSDGRVLAGQASACAPNLTPAEVGAAR
jgi:hypothetical protein